jgi:hypothetical protein
VPKAVCICISLNSLVMYWVSFPTYVNVAHFFPVSSMLVVLFRGWLCVDYV